MKPPGEPMIAPQPGGGRIITYPKTGLAEDEEARAGCPIITAGVFTSGLLSADDLVTIEIPSRENFCGTWFRQGDLGFIFGERGLGKTWLALDLARGLAEGRAVGPWAVPKGRRVLYIDGEMPLDGLRDRNSALRRCDGPLTVLNHEWLFQKAGCVLNLSDAGAQAALLGVCETQKYEVMILDNLSCLFSGVPENEADAWGLVLPWLLELRRRKIAVVVVHHSGRAGTHMRGTSRREDAAFWVLRLDAVPDPCPEGAGAKFITRFTKNRQGTREETEPLEWTYQPDGAGIKATFRAIPTLEVFRQWVSDGLTSCTELAEEMGISKGAVSKLARRAERDGWLVMEGRNYQLREGA